MPRFDLVIKGGRLVVPFTGVIPADIGISGGRIRSIADAIASSQAHSVVDARGKFIFPGAVDSHYHVGIYRPFSEDAETESRSSLVGGVTTILSYFRTGHHYLNKSGPYAEIFPEVLALSRDHFYTDYGFHVAIMTTEQLGEVDDLVLRHGVRSFKFYMFYKGLNLAADSTRGSDYTMAENYDLGHLFLLMERVADASRRYGEDGRIALSLHCENSELIRVFIEKVRVSGARGLEAYSRARPPLTEHLSIFEAVLLADATRCPINLLHLSSKQALRAAIRARHTHPAMDIVLETTLHHLALSCTTAGITGKVNPPLRSSADIEYLWNGIGSGEIDTVASDHACCMEEFKKEDDLWGSLPGFGGSSLLYPLLISEGHHKRRIALTRIAELVSANPARHFALYPAKGTICIGADADLAIVDLDRRRTVSPELLQSAQEYSPFTGVALNGWPTETILKGRIVYAKDRAQGPPSGEYLTRPMLMHTQAFTHRLATKSAESAGDFSA